MDIREKSFARYTSWLVVGSLMICQGAQRFACAQKNRPDFLVVIEKPKKNYRLDQDLDVWVLQREGGKQIRECEPGRDVATLKILQNDKVVGELPLKPVSQVSARVVRNSIYYGFQTTVSVRQFVRQDQINSQDIYQLLIKCGEGSSEPSKSFRLRP